MDLIFAQTAFVAASICYTQTFVYPSHSCLKTTKITVGCIVGIFFFVGILEGQFGIALKSYTGISLINLAAFIKAGSSLTKYTF